MKWIGQIVNDVKVNFSNDGEIYVIGDDLYIENVTQDKDIIFKTNDGGTATEVMRIDGSTSNVGIGTNSPSQGLHVVDSGILVSQFESSNNTTSQIQVTNSSGTDAYFGISGSRLVLSNNDYSADHFSMDSSGNVGIGTSSPAYTLDVAGVINTNSNYRQGGVKILGRESSNTVLEAGGDNDIIFETNNSEKVRVLSNGNVGIGTSSPDEKLHIYQGAFAMSSGVKDDYVLDSNNILIYNTAATGTYPFDASGHLVIQPRTSASRDILFATRDSDTATSPKMVIKDTGNVGIGTSSPQKTLDVAGGDIRLDNSKGIYFSTVDANIGRVSITGDESNDFIRLKVDNNNSHVINLNTTGVGVGTISPASKLHVAGTVQVGVDDTGHDVKFFGATSGASFLYDESEDGVVITHPTDDAGLEVYTISSGTPLSPQLKVGRDYTQYWGVYTVDRTAHLVHRQDETDSGAMNTSFELWGNGSGNDNWVWRHGTRSGGSLATVMTLDKAGQLTVTGEIEGGSLDINGNADISGTLTTANTTITGDLTFGNGGDRTIIGPQNEDLILNARPNGSDEGLKIQIGGTDKLSVLQDGGTTFAGTLTVGVDDTGHDVKFFGATASHYAMWDQSKDLFQVAGDLEIKNANGSNPSDAGSLVFNESGATWGSDMYGFRVNLEGSSNLLQFQSANTSTVSTILTMGRDNLTSTFSGPLTVGIDDTGHDVKFFGATSGKYLLWDESDDSLNLTDSTQLKIGAAADLRLYHDGSDSYLRAYGTTDLIIMHDQADRDIKFKADDGSGGTTEYFRLDGGVTEIIVSKKMQFGDDVKAVFGAGEDLDIFHDGTNSTINNAVGNLILSNDADDGDIIFKSDNGSGGLSTYLTIDGGSSRIEVAKNMRFADSVSLLIGGSSDLSLLHDGFDSYINANGVGNLYIKQNNNDKDIIFQCDDGSGGVETYFFLDGSAGHTTVQKKIKFEDSVIASFGAGDDFYISHNGSYTSLMEQTSDLYISNSADDKDIIFRCDDGSGGITAYLTLDGSAVKTFVSTQFGVGGSPGAQLDVNSGSTNTVAIFESTDDKAFIKIKDDNTDVHLIAKDNKFSIGESSSDYDNFKVDITSGDTDIAGALQLNSTLTVGVDDTGHDVKFFGATSGRYLLWDESADSLEFTDNAKAVFGIDNDMKLYHDASNSYITANGTGHLYIMQQATDADISFQSDDGSGGDAEYLRIDGGDEQVKVFKNLTLDDNIQAWFGSGNDLRIYHDGSNSHIYANGTGNVVISQDTADQDIILKCDDGSGGNTAYLTLDGSEGHLTVQKEMNFADSVRATFGNLAGGDMAIYHDGTNNYHNHYTGDVYFRNNTDNGDIIFQSDDNSGGIATYLTINGGEGQTVADVDINFRDDVKASFGNLASGDLRISHDATDSLINNFTGDLYVRNNANDKDIIFQSDNGSGGVATYFSLDGSLAAHDGSATTALFTKWGDNSKIAVGNGADGRFYHNATNTYLENTNGDLYIQNKADDKDIIFQCDDGSGGIETYFFLDGSASSGNPVTIFPDNSKLAIGTSSHGISLVHDGSDSTITNAIGNLTITNFQDDGDIIFNSDDGSGSTTEYLRFDGGAAITVVSKEMRFADNVKLKLGSGPDLEIYHDGSNSYITQSGTGHLQIRQTQDDKDIKFECDDGSGGTTTYLYLDGSVTRTIFSQEARFTDSVNLKFGTGGDMMLYHDGSNSYIDHTGTGDLLIRQGQDDKDIKFVCDDSSGSLATYLTIDGSASQVLSSVTLKSTPPNANTHSLILGRSDTGNVWNVNHAGNDFRLYNTAGSGSDILFGVDSGSNAIANKVGIGVATPASLLHVAGTVQVGIDDTGHDVKFYGATSGEFMLWDESEDALRLTDNTELRLGTGSDLRFFHNGTNSFAVNYSGDFYISNNATDKDIIFQCDNGSGGEETYFKLDGSTGYTQFPDSKQLAFGSDNDMRVYSSGSTNFIISDVGDLSIQQKANDKDIIFKCDDGSGGTETYFYLDGGNTNIRFVKNIYLLDNVRLLIGSGTDLEIYHDGTDNYIHADSGDLIIEQTANDKDIIFKCDDGSGGVETYFYLDGSLGSDPYTIFPDSSTLALGTGYDLRLYHDGSNSYMRNTTGNLIIQAATTDGDLIFQSDDGSGGETAYLTLDGSAGHTKAHKEIQFEDNVIARFGAGNDMSISHDGTNTNFSNVTGDLFFTNTADDKDISFRCDDGSGGTTAYLTLDGSAAETKVDKDMRFSDNVNLRIGTNSDVVIVHDNSNFTTTNYTGNYNIINQQLDGDIVFQTDDGSGGVETYLTIDGGSQEIIATKPIVTGESQIKVLPHHFMSNEDGGANKSAQFRDDTIIGVRTSADSAELYAFVEIPYGKTARTVTVYGNDTSLVVNVFKSDINAGALTDITNAGGCVVGTECDIVDTAYSATNYLVIKVTTVSYTNDIVYGAVVTIG